MLDDDSAGVGIGILFSPEYEEFSTSANKGFGIVAVQEAPGVSKLVFITDPVDSFPKERMVILDNGNIGIASSNPNYLFTVDGDMAVSGNLVVDSLEVSNLSFLGSDNLNFTGETLQFNNKVTFNESVYFADTFSFSNLDTKPTDTSRAYLYLDQNELVFQRPESGTIVNLTNLFSGTDNQILVFDENGSLTSSDGINVDRWRSGISVGK